MAGYIDEELLIEKMTRLRGCSCSYSDEIIDEVEDIISDISTEDVIEKAKVDKAIEEIMEYVKYCDENLQAPLISRAIYILKRNIGENK